MKSNEIRFKVGDVVKLKDHLKENGWFEGSCVIESFMLRDTKTSGNIKEIESDNREYLVLLEGNDSFRDRLYAGDHLIIDEKETRKRKIGILLSK